MSSNLAAMDICSHRVGTMCNSAAGEDYTAVSMTVMFQPTENSQVVNVPIFNDNVSEDVEQFTVELSLPSVVGQQSGGVLVGNTASVQIIDDDCKSVT